jgi:hypothetical protein
MRKISSILLLLGGAALGLSLGFSNCSPVDFTSPPQAAATNPGAQGVPDPEPDPQTIDQVRKACENGNYTEKNVAVKFPNPRTPDPKLTCAWSQGGNLGLLDGHFQARVEQNVEFDLPVGSKICDMAFSFPDQSMKYDDHIFLAFDDALLAASYPVDDRLPKSSAGIMTYSWSSLVGTTWPLGNFAYVYCLGKDEGKSSCHWPETETQGTISMNFDPTILQTITARNIGRTIHQFKFITTGDNDSTDCQHEPLEFSVRVRYTQ